MASDLCSTATSGPVVPGVGYALQPTRRKSEKADGQELQS